MCFTSLIWWSDAIDPPLAVVPVLFGPLQAFLALLPAILAALGSLLLAMLKPSGFKKLLKFLWYQKILSAALALVAVGYYTEIPGRYLRVRTTASADSNAHGAATDWSAFGGGPARTGGGPGSDRDAAPTRGDLVWTFDRTPTIFSSPAISGDRVYLSSVGGIGPFTPAGKGAIVCLDAHTGREIWSYEPEDFRATFSSPVVKDGFLICGEGLHMVRDARVTCLDLAGRRLWELRTESHVESSACIDHGRAYIGAGDDGFYCVDLEPNADGTPRVRWHLDGRQFPDCESSPIVADGVVYFGLGEGGRAVCAVDTETGTELWRVNTPYPVFAPPTFAGGRIYIGMGNGNFIQTAEEVMEGKLEQMRQDNKSAEEIAAAAANLGPAGEVWCIDAKTHTVTWRFKLARTVLGAVAFHDDQLYFGSCDGYFYSVSSTGQLLQRHNVHESILSSPALGAGQVYFSTRSGRLYCLSTETLKPIWSSLLGEGASFTSSPAVAHGHVYVGTSEDGLRCVGQPGTPAPPIWNHGETGGVADGDALPIRAAPAWHWPESDGERFQVTAPLMVLGDSIYAAGMTENIPQLAKLSSAPDLEDQRRCQWSVTLNSPLHIPPAGWRDLIYTVERVAASNQSALCVRDHDGQASWDYSISSGNLGRFTLDQQQLFIWNNEHELSCLGGSFERLNQIWKQRISAGKSVGDPVAIHDLVLVTTETDTVALDDQSGVVLWQIKTDRPLFGPVAIGNNFLLATEKELSLCRIVDGGVIWTAQLGRLMSRPVVYGAHVAVVTEAGKLVLLNRDDGTEIRRAACDNGSVPLFIDAKRAIFLQGDDLMSLAFDDTDPMPWCSLKDFGRLVAPLISLKGRAYCATERGIVCLAPEQP
jgi:outer membrane protein assembly factor BamB